MRAIHFYSLRKNHPPGMSATFLNIKQMAANTNQAELQSTWQYHFKK